MAWSARDLQDSIEEYYERQHVKEFNFISIAQQGMRSAIDILANVLLRQGQGVAINTNLGRRSNSPNIISLRFGDTPHLSLGVWAIRPTGLMVLHECLFLATELIPGREPGIGAQPVVAQTHGLLMVCSDEAPEQLSLPVDFEGTVATADAEAIYLDTVGRRPPPYSIAALGLFARAVPEVDFELLKDEVRRNTSRFGERVRDANIRALETVYKQTRIANSIVIPGQQSREAYWAAAQRTLSGLGEEARGAAESMVGYAWRTRLPVCDMKKCTCVECVAAYYCPEGAIAWKDDIYHVDYDFCKGCGTCARECSGGAVTMKPAREVLGEVLSGGPQCGREPG